VLPTCGTARFASALGVDDFVRRSGLVCYCESDLRQASAGIALLARSEGLEAHARAIEIRFDGAKNV